MEPAATARWSSPEWSAHRACYLAWPYLRDEWGDALQPAQSEWAALVAALIDGGESVNVLVPSAEEQALAEAALQQSGAALPLHRFVASHYGDIWLRDTAPLFVWAGQPEAAPGAQPQAKLQAVAPRFNGWGGKYIFPGDTEVAAQLAERERIPLEPLDLVLEGGALELNGQGLLITTRDCILNNNRNPSLSAGEVESRLGRSLGVEKTIWLSRGLERDHTDGHADTLARFTDPASVVCMAASDDNDPNREVLGEVEETLRQSSDAAGRPLSVVTVPSPGLVLDASGEPLPASYLNFVLTRRSVVVPTYGSVHDWNAVTEIGRLFPGRTAVGRSAREILTGGGAFHCISKEIPQNPGPMAEPVNHV